MDHEPTEWPKPLAQLAASELLRLPPETLQRLKYRWDLWRLPHQILPPGTSTWVCRGGRGSGKTTGIVQQVRQDVYDGVMSFAFVGRTADSVRDDMVLGPVGIRNSDVEELKAARASQLELDRRNEEAAKEGERLRLREEAKTRRDRRWAIFILLLGSALGVGAKVLGDYWVGPKPMNPPIEGSR